MPSVKADRRTSGETVSCLNRLARMYVGYQLMWEGQQRAPATLHYSRVARTISWSIPRRKKRRASPPLPSSTTGKIPWLVALLSQRKEPLGTKPW